jgi:hypothetical protein
MPHPSEAEVMRGGPGDAGAPAPADGSPAPYDGPDAAQRQPAAAPAADTARVVLGGVAYDVPANLADAFRKERDRIAGQAGARIQHLERRLSALEQDDDYEAEPQVAAGAQPPDPANLDPASEKYDPSKYHRDNLAYQQWLVATGLEQVEQRRLEEQRIASDRQAQAADWQRHVTAFYQTNPELRGNEDLVDAVWRNQFPKLKDLPLEEGFAELAKLSKQRLIQLTESGRRVTARRSPQLETSGSTRAAAAARREPDEVSEPVRGGLSAVIKARQRRFRSPNFGARESAA